MHLFDTHAHLDDEQFGANLGAVIQRATDVGLQHLVAVGTTAESSLKCLELAAKYSTVHAAVGIQPNYCSEAKPTDWQTIVELTKREGVVAIGETGLDRYWDHTPFELQQDYFQRHLDLSRQTQLPFIVHMRDCLDEIVVMLQEARRQGPLLGVMHSYTGDAAGARECLSLGMYISFAGMVTYKKSEALREVASLIPADRLLIETDSPYLSPHPKRSVRPNEPALIVHTAQCLAEVRAVTLSEIAEQTTANAKRLFLPA
ncbi:MAG: TatD family hydrolase [Pirellulaceae bacterium]|nr:TatD family hydrolase [Pirellulaceae bacterium]